MKCNGAHGAGLPIKGPKITLRKFGVERIVKERAGQRSGNYEPIGPSIGPAILHFGDKIKFETSTFKGRGSKGKCGFPSFIGIDRR